MTPIALALLAAAPPQALPPPAPATQPAPSAEAVALGQRLARAGTLSALLPALTAKETDDLVAAHPELSLAEQASLRAAAAKVAADTAGKLYAATGAAYASRLSVTDLRTLVAFQESAAAARYRAAEPQAILAATRAMGTSDFKTETAKAFCAQTGKLCAK